MQVIHEVFMLVFEEMSVKRAAERAFVTQQCVSNHIKRLEKMYKVDLFTRKPRFQPTEVGKALYRSLLKIKAIEQGIHYELQQYCEGTSGSFSMGISASRAQIVLPLILPKYYEAFPNVEISFIMGDTIALEEELLQGKIDLLFGVNTRNNQLFEYIPIWKDEICLIISDGLLRKKFGTQADKIVLEKADLRQFQDVPFIQSNLAGAIDSIMQNYLDKNHISLHSPYHISDTNTQLSLCAKGLCASLNPKMLLSNISNYNLHCCRPEEYIHIISLDGFNEYLRIELVFLKDIIMPPYLREFQNILIKSICENYN